MFDCSRDGVLCGLCLIAVGMVSKPVSEPAPEFHIQQEDFPALPGAQSKHWSLLPPLVLHVDGWWLFH